MQETLSILIVSSTGLAGGDYHILKVANLWRTKANVTILSSSRSISRFEFPELSTITYFCPIPEPRNPSPLLYELLEGVRGLFTLMIRPTPRYDIIIAPSHFCFQVLRGQMLKLKMGKKDSRLVIFFHDLLIPGKTGSLKRFLSVIYNVTSLKFTCFFADLVFTINTRSRHIMLRLGFPERKLIQTSNGIDMEITHNARLVRRFDMIFVGRLTRDKGVTDLLEVLSEIAKKRPNTSLVVVGEGPERKRLQERCNALGLNNHVVFTGRVSEAVKLRLLRESSVFVCPSYQESWSIAVAEAMACSLPVIAYDLPIYREIFSQAFLTVRVGDTCGMAEKALFLLENPDAAIKMGDNANRFVTRYTWTSVAKQELSVLEGGRLTPSDGL